MGTLGERLPGAIERVGRILGSEKAGSINRELLSDIMALHGAAQDLSRLERAQEQAAAEGARMRKLLDQAEEATGGFFLYSKNLEGDDMDVLHEHGNQRLLVGVVRRAADFYADLFFDLRVPDAEDAALAGQDETGAGAEK